MDHASIRRLGASAIAWLAPPTQEVEEPAEASVWIALARCELYLEYEVSGISGRTVASPAVGEQPHAVLRDRIDTPIVQCR